MTVTELRQKRAALAAQARELLDKAEGENRALSADESQTWDRMMADVDDIGARVERMEKLANIETEQSESRGRKTQEEYRSTSRPDNQMALRSWFLAGSDVQLSADQYRSMEQAGFRGNKLVLSL